MIIYCYCKGRTGRDVTNAWTVDLGTIQVWFSYTTPVAFRAPGKGLVVRENDWGSTTGKHLKSIDGGGSAKERRVSGDTFEAMLSEAMPNGIA